MANNNINKENPNGVSLSYSADPGHASVGNSFQPIQLPSGSGINQPPMQMNPSFPRFNPGNPSLSFPYTTVPQQSVAPLPDVSNASGYPQHDGVEQVDEHPRPAPATNGSLVNSSLLQMLGGNFPRQAAGPAAETYQEQDPAPPQGPAILSQLNSTAEFFAGRGDFANAINYYEKIIGIDSENGAAWTALGHCYLLTDNLQKAFTSYQKALYSLPDVRDPQLWYGVGLLYEKVLIVPYLIV